MHIGSLFLTLGTAMATAVQPPGPVVDRPSLDHAEAVVHSESVVKGKTGTLVLLRLKPLLTDALGARCRGGLSVELR